MSASNQKPLIFLAFAQDRDDSAKYLRNIPAELRQIRAALESARNAGLCEIVERANATSKDILEVFQHRDYRHRIAIFHYGGHANGFQLLLESPEGKTQLAHAGGLAAFLGQQHGLQLVFLNGCSTQQQVQGLLQANIPSVIATSQAIVDAVATEFATSFYQGLGSGASIRQAYEEAAAAVRIQKGDDLRHVYVEGAPREDRWPWALTPEQGEAVEWNLRVAADDPTFGLPPIPPGDLPAEPFRHLDWFSREHAEVFFGRGHTIRQLYDLITTPQTDPIILLHGQTGVGKSSLLDAGLRPRLENTHEIRYHRRNKETGLWGTLQQALLPAAKEQSVDQAWRELETQLGKPLLLILDQVEEVFTQPNKNLRNELHDFLSGLKMIFGNYQQRPKGKLILGFRKEWLAEIRERLGESKLPASLVFLEPLQRREIIAAISGPTQSPRLQAKYGLTIEDGLPEIIAEDLLEDRGSPLAPTLQILLTKMWQKAREQDFGHPRFTKELYQTLKKQGILLKDFLDAQLSELRTWQPEIVDSGLAIDLLAFHTTPLDTAEQRTVEQLEQTYAHRKDVLTALIEKCKELRVLSDPATNRMERALATSTRLAHDTLAPLVRQQFDESDKAGQRAARILKSKLTNFNTGDEGVLLDEADLAVVQSGKNGMRQLSVTEQSLITRSQEYIQQRNREMQRMQEKIKYTDDEVPKWLQERGYYDLHKNPTGKGIQHQYEVVERHGKKVVFDHAVGLIWQQSGSEDRLEYLGAEEYIRELNSKRFAGFNDWRLPTLEEAMMLMEPKKKNGDLHIDPVFYKEQRWIWTSSKLSASVAWKVDFYIGNCNYITAEYNGSHVRAVRSKQ